MERILDTHVHVYDANALNLDWVADAPLLDGVWAADAYASEAMSVGIDAAVYMEVDAPPQSWEAEFSAIRSEMDRPDTLLRTAVVGGDPAMPGFVDWLDALGRDSRVVGVRRVLHTDASPSGRCLEPAFIAGVRALGERGMVFDACVRPGELGDVIGLARACPGTTIVLDHLGNPAVSQGVDPSWWEVVSGCAEERNIVGKLSGLIQHMHADDWTTATFAPFMDRFVEVFGPSRITWASNWPVCNLHGSLARWVETSLEFLSGFSPDERAAILRTTGQRIYRVG